MEGKGGSRGCVCKELLGGRLGRETAKNQKKNKKVPNPPKVGALPHRRNNRKMKKKILLQSYTVVARTTVRTTVQIPAYYYESCQLLLPLKPKYPLDNSS